MNRTEIKIGSVYDWVNPPHKDLTDPKERSVKVRRVRVIEDLNQRRSGSFALDGQTYSFPCDGPDWLFGVEDIETRERFGDKECLSNGASAGDLRPVQQPSEVS